MATESMQKNNPATALQLHFNYSGYAVAVSHLGENGHMHVHSCPWARSARKTKENVTQRRKGKKRIKSKHKLQKRKDVKRSTRNYFTSCDPRPGTYLDIHSDIYSDILSGILPAIISNILLRVYSGIPSESDAYSCILSGCDWHYALAFYLASCLTNYLTFFYHFV